MISPPPARTPRLREHGVRLGRLEPGPLNAITDVAGVAVGHVTVWRDEPDPPEGRGVARTGITAVVPHSPTALLRDPIPAGGAVLNGAGEMTGFIQVSEWGVLDSPVYLTSTHAVGRVYDGAVAAAVAADSRVGVDDVVIPLVAECDDSRLSEARVVQVEAADVSRALEAASSGPVREGAVGAGAGMVAFGHKAGIGTASRELPSGGVVGVLVLANFGSRRDLLVGGVPVGRALTKADEDESRVAGSCIAVVAADVPLSAHALTRAARRAGLGLARAGSVAHHGSGEIFIAFSTEGGAESVARDVLDDLFLGVVEATEEAALNALWAAPDVQGRGGRVVQGLPHDQVLELLAAHGRRRDR
jgi:D-aminopeptidase